MKIIIENKLLNNIENDIEKNAITLPNNEIKNKENDLEKIKINIESVNNKDDLENLKLFFNLKNKCTLELITDKINNNFNESFDAILDFLYEKKFKKIEFYIEESELNLIKNEVIKELIKKTIELINKEIDDTISHWKYINEKNPTE